jgi:hypothetical protein
MEKEKEVKAGAKVLPHPVVADLDRLMQAEASEWDAIKMAIAKAFNLPDCLERAVMVGELILDHGERAKALYRRYLETQLMGSLRTMGKTYQVGGASKEDIVRNILERMIQMAELSRKQAERDKKESEANMVKGIEFICGPLAGIYTGPNKAICPWPRDHYGREMLGQLEFRNIILHAKKVLIEKGICKGDRTGDEDVEALLRAAEMALGQLDFGMVKNDPQGEWWFCKPECSEPYWRDRFR